MKQLVIFDLDGTLLNTIDDLGNAANHALEANGYPVHALSSYPFFVGNGVNKLLERVLPEDCRNKMEVERLKKAFMDYYDAHDADHTRPYAGITELLDELTDRGIKAAVASNKYSRATKRLIARFFPQVPWAVVEGQRDNRPVKPDPSVVFDILAQCPTPKADVLYVGDSGVDMETARRACVDSVGVTWGLRPVKELREHYAGCIVDRPSQILNIALNGLPLT